MDNQRIKIGYANGTESSNLFGKMYEALKSYGNGEGEFHRHGRIYNIKGLDSLISTYGEGNVIMNEQIREDRRNYREARKEKSRAFNKAKQQEKALN